MAAAQVIDHWNPEDPGFWASRGRGVATRNLWLSIPALTLAFAVWMVWSVVVVHLPAAGFRYSTNQLFWLAALPALCGATLRIFYAFAVPVFGGRRFTALATASLLLPASASASRCRQPDTPYEAMVALALLCGLGGGNFASSMAHISYFYPTARKGYALGMNAGLGHLGVSIVQLGGAAGHHRSASSALSAARRSSPRRASRCGCRTPASSGCRSSRCQRLAAWFGMNDMADAQASFADQAVIFMRKHNWLMCWLYLGTFGSFIGYSAGLPLLIKSQFPGIDALQYAWLGPLVGALMRPLGGWLADKVGGARVTFWTFIAMALGVLAVLQFLPQGGQAQGGNFAAFLISFMVLFAAAGIGNGSTFRMIPVIFLTERRRAAAGESAAVQEQATKDANKEAAATLGFASAIGCLRRLLHAQELRHVDRADRRARRGALLFHRVLRHLHRDDLVVLQPQERGNALLSN